MLSRGLRLPKLPRVKIKKAPVKEVEEFVKERKEVWASEIDKKFGKLGLVAVGILVTKGVIKCKPNREKGDILILYVSPQN